MSYYKKKYGFIKKNFINAINISDSSISIPVGPHINKIELKKIIKNYCYILTKLNI
jgi:dTDP-4-amino-4,6-dideoxygalactose transaminase